MTKVLKTLMTTELQTKNQAVTRMPIRPQDESFLGKVMAKSGISNLYDARDLTEYVFRTMRDLMTTEAAADIASELQTPAGSKNTVMEGTGTGLLRVDRVKASHH